MTETGECSPRHPTTKQFDLQTYSKGLKFLFFNVVSTQVTSVLYPEYILYSYVPAIFLYIPPSLSLSPMPFSLFLSTFHLLWYLDLLLVSSHSKVFPVSCRTSAVLRAQLVFFSLLNCASALRCDSAPNEQKLIDGKYIQVK